MNDRTIMQQALEAWDNPMGMKDLCVAMDALRKALEQPEQEPSQWRDMVVVNLVREGINKHKARDLADHFATTPPAAQRKKEHITNGDPCWCNPEIDYVDPETGVAVIVHKEPQ